MISISEPVTVLTDCLLGGCTLVWARRLHTAGETGWRTIRCWTGFYIATSSAAFVGGGAHGLAQILSRHVSVFLWIVIVGCVWLASSQFLKGLVHAFIPPRRLRPFIFISWTLPPAAGFAAALTGAPLFHAVVYGYLVSLSAGVWMIFSALRRRAPAAIWIIGGILFSFAAGFVQIGEIRVHARFNHNDLYHVIQTAAMYFLYRGGMLLSDAD